MFITDTNNNKIATVTVIKTDVPYLMRIVRNDFDASVNDLTKIRAIQCIQFSERYGLPQDFINGMKNDLKNG